MTFEFEVESLVVTVKLENKNNMKHCYLRVLDSKTVHIKAHRFFSQHDAQKLLHKKSTWILNKLKKYEKNSLEPDEFFYFGKKQSKQIYNILDIDKFYKEKIKEYIPYLVEKHSQNMQLFPTSIKYRKNQRTWGSCNYKNGLNFNILLMKFPLEVIEYVVIHELAHIKHKNHSKDFWDLVRVHCPDYKQRENILKSFL